MINLIKVEIPVPTSSKFLNSYKTIGDLRKIYPNLEFIKYIYLDPTDGKMKGANPPDDLPLVPNAYITIAGEFDEVIKFTKDLVAS